MAYFAVGVNDKVGMWAYAGGSVALKATIADPYGTVRATPTVSPDEQRLAWVEDNGALIVANLDGSQNQTLLTGVATAGKDAPMWTADGKKLVTNKATVDIVTKQVTADPFKGNYQTLSPGSGQFIAYKSNVGTSRVIVGRADGTKVSEAPISEGERSVLAVSPDGRYVAIGGWPTTGERESNWRTILDMRTGQTALTLERPPALRYPVLLLVK